MNFTRKSGPYGHCTYFIKLASAGEGSSVNIILDVEKYAFCSPTPFLNIFTLFSFFKDTVLLRELKEFNWFNIIGFILMLNLLIFLRDKEQILLTDIFTKFS